MPTPIEACLEVTHDWASAAYRHLCWRAMLPAGERPEWASTIPRPMAANRMRMVIRDLLGSLSIEQLLRATIQITNDASAGCLLIVEAEGGERVATHILRDGTIDMRFYRGGEFRYGSVLYPDGQSSCFFDEPVEVI